MQILTDQQMRKYAVDYFTAKGMPHCCAPASIYVVTGEDLDKILLECERVGWRPHQGMSLWQEERVLTALGYDWGHVAAIGDAHRRRLPGYSRPVVVGNADLTLYTERRLTLAQFCKKYPRGRYFVAVRGHALAVIGGQPVDFERAMRRRVRWAIHVRGKLPITTERAASGNR